MNSADVSGVATQEFLFRNVDDAWKFKILSWKNAETIFRGWIDTGRNVSSCSFFFALFLLNKKHLADGFSTGRSHRMLRLLRQGAHVAVPALCYKEPSIN